MSDQALTPSKRLIETAIQLGALIMCFAVTGAAIVFARSVLRDQKPAAPNAAEQVQPGDVLTISTELPPGADAYLVLVLSSTCVYCNASMPFYRDLVASVEKEKLPVRVVAASGEPATSMDAYVATNGLNVSALSLADLGIRIRGTPTIVLVGADQRVRKVWPGLLNEAAQPDVLAALRDLQ